MPQIINTDKERLVQMIDPLILTSSATIEALTSEPGKLWNTPRRQLRKALKAAIGTAPDDMEEALRALIAEGDLHAFDARRASRWWARAYYIFGLPAAVLAAVAAATGLASTAGRVPAAIIALVSAGLSAAAAFLKSDENQREKIMMSAAWSELADDARLQHASYTQEVEKISDSSDKMDLTDDYWARVLSLHRRKGRLLRGDSTAPAESS